MSGEATLTADQMRMDRYEVEMLATYNSEKARGLVHTPEWSARMEEFQRRFNLVTYGTEKPRPGAIYEVWRVRK